MAQSATAGATETTTRLTFSVDAALLAELGERLVGEPHIALGELIKNGYDADASRVRIHFTGDELIVEDDGHGMTFDEFDRLWMRVGSTHKREQRTSHAD
jgi:HSP90 family molecular chaperone